MSTNLIHDNLVDNKTINKLCENEKKTSPLITKYEYSNIISIRMTQLADGAVCFIDDEGFDNIEEIVHEEIKQSKLPFIIERKMPNAKSEFWKLSDMIMRL